MKKTTRSYLLQSLRFLCGRNPSLLVSLISLFIVTGQTEPAFAFYQWKSETGSVELRGQVRLFGMAIWNPEDQFFYENKTVQGGGALARMVLEAKVGEGLGFDFHAYQTYIPNSLVTGPGSTGAPLDVERSAALEWNLKDGAYSRLAVDRASVRYSFGRADVTVGRQPVNLATTYYFTPNDYFAPFSAQAFYRVYKPGVDAARAEVRLGGLSQLSLISVLGYSQDPSTETGWSRSPDGDRTSYVARISTVFNDVEWAVLGGTVRGSEVIGGSVQGELFQWLGVRAEGHRSAIDDPAQRAATKAVIGFEHRWKSSLEIRLEQFYYGAGAGAVDNYGAQAPTAGELVYLARHYTAVGAGLEFTPLLRGDLVGLFNGVDHSMLLTGNAVYSLSDESELSVTMSVPVGKKPEGLNITSEFGLYPSSLNIEIRTSF